MTVRVVDEWLFAAAMTSVTSIPCMSAARANSLARPMFTSRYVVSASLLNSAASAEDMATTSASSTEA